MSNTPKRSTFRFVIAVIAATGFGAPGAFAQSTSGYDRALEIASFDTAWTRVQDSYYDASMRGLNWLALRDSLRPIVERGDSRDDRASPSPPCCHDSANRTSGCCRARRWTPRRLRSDRAGDAGLEFVSSIRRWW
jgi:hypothetical protein